MVAVERREGKFHSESVPVNRRALSAFGTFVFGAILIMGTFRTLVRYRFVLDGGGKILSVGYSANAGSPAGGKNYA